MFTSRLPKSTSARRPSNPSDGSTSLIGSNIPISVRKANLFTPQPQRSLQVGINSTSRKSIMTTDKKYQRTSKPVPDRDEQMRMFENLVDFLQENTKNYASNFPIPEAKRFFSSVSTTECTRIFEFLISRLYPDFKINKLEIDVPETMAALDYPYIRSVTKSALVSITTRQAIANLLVIFDWLVNFVKISTMPNVIDDEQEDPVLSCIMLSPNPDGEVEFRMMDRFKKDSRPPGDIEEINSSIERISQEIHELKELIQELNSFEEDAEKCLKYDQDMRKYIKTKREQEIALQQKNLALGKEISDISKENEILLPSVGPEMDDDYSDDQATVARLKEEVRLLEKEFESGKQDSSLETVLAFGRGQEEDLEKFTVKLSKLESELALREANESNRVQTLKAKGPKQKEEDDMYLRECLESNKLDILSTLREAEAGAKGAMEAAELVREDNKLLRQVARRVKREV